LDKRSLFDRKVPFVVSVSGHRDILEEDVPDLRRLAANALKKIERAAPHTPQILLSGLASGGDQLVAEEAIKRDWMLVAVLPMPLADYLQDFKEGDERQRILDLIAKSRHTIELPWAATCDSDIQVLRDQQYRNQGIYIVRQAQVVISVWDGMPPVSQGACGTAYVVKLCRNGTPPIDDEILSAPEITSVIQVPARRKGMPERKTRIDAPIPSDALYKIIGKNISAFNRSQEKQYKNHPDRPNNSIKWLLPKDTHNSIDAGTKFLINAYGDSDALSIESQKIRNSVVRVASCLTVLGAFSQAAHSAFQDKSWLIAYGVALALAYGLYILLFKLPTSQIEMRFLEYRALAEGLRVQIFWRIAGIKANTADHFLQLVKSDVGWIREALRNCSFVALLSTSGESNYDLVKTCWVDDQTKYFLGKDPGISGGKYKDCKNISRQFEIFATVSLVVGGALVGMAAMSNVYQFLTPWKTIASAFSASFFLMAGVVKAYVATMGYVEQVASYETMGNILRNAQVILNSHNETPERQEECFLALGKLSLAENAEWLLMHRRNAFKIQS